MDEFITSQRPFFKRWLRLTWAGWVLGIPLIVVLALAGEVVGIGGSQVLVGLGMGIGVGLMQARAIRAVLDNSGAWFWSCAIGLALPFLASDIAGVAEWDVSYSLHVCVALGGFLVGLWQSFLLRRSVAKAGYWVGGSALGWLLAAAPVALVDALPLRGIWGAVLYLSGAVVGGLILGAVTGRMLIWLHRGGEISARPDKV
ncbi:MAG TPA: hypothetical protein VKP65_25680 [Rhodothermales bacterium]|nr:hypothetical protein [Rhodothermales bacterium]